jgi:hypothetical protein
MGEARWQHQGCRCSWANQNRSKAGLSKVRCQGRTRSTNRFGSAATQANTGLRARFVGLSVFEVARHGCDVGVAMPKEKAPSIEKTF